MPDGTRCDVTNSVRLQVKLSDFTWKHEFKLLNGRPFPIILGLDFLQRTSMVVDMASRSFSFRFAPQCSGRFGNSGEGIEGEPFIRNFVAQVCGSAEGKGAVLSILTEEYFPLNF